ncbi:MAG: hypothetical protein RLZZ15_1631 [Verrucomicrobiota bacterium]
MSGSDPETVLVFPFGAVGAIWLFHVYDRLANPSPLGCGSGPRLTLGSAIAGCHVALWIALAGFASAEVRRDLGLQAVFCFALTVALAVVTNVLALLGVDAFGDGIERNNPAARRAALGAWAAVTLCAIGANLGEGDFAGTALLPLALSVAALLGASLAVSVATRGFLPIVVEREAAAGGRFATLCVACALPLARASAGDWVSFASTLGDFLRAAVAVAIIAAAAVFGERHLARASAAAIRPTLRMALPSAVMLGLGVAAFLLV